MLSTRLVVEKVLASSMLRLQEMHETDENVAKTIVEAVVAF